MVLEAVEVVFSKPHNSVPQINDSPPYHERDGPFGAASPLRLDVCTSVLGV